MHDELACASLMLRASYYADLHLIDDFIGLFAEDGRVERMGEPFVGLDAIRSFMAGRSPERVTRHVLAPPIITLDSAEAGSGIAYFVVYDAIDTTQQRPLPLTTPATVGEFRQTYRKVDGNWRIVSHSSSATFRRTN